VAGLEELREMLDYILTSFFAFPELMKPAAGDSKEMWKFPGVSFAARR
jgi:hypothetical protein